METIDIQERHLEDPDAPAGAAADEGLVDVFNVQYADNKSDQVAVGMQNVTLVIVVAWSQNHINVIWISLSPHLIFQIMTLMVHS